MVDVHWMAVLNHIILWEWIKTIPTKKRAENEHP